MNANAEIDFKSIFNAAPGLYMVLDPELKIVAANTSYMEATLTSNASIIGKNLFEVFPDNPADELADGVLNLKTSLLKVIKTHQPDRMAIQKYDIRKPDGEFEIRYWSPENIPVLNERHELLYILHKAIDITENYIETEKYKKLENDYRLIVNNVSDYAIFRVDPYGSVATWNNGAALIKGYTADEIIGKSIATFYTEKDIRNGVAQQNLEMALQRGHYETEGLRVRKDGTLFCANIVITALRDEKGKFYGYSKITRDITEKNKTQEKLEFLTRQIDLSYAAIVTTDAERKITSWNQGATILYGYTKDEVLGKDSGTIFKSPYSEDEIKKGVGEINKSGYWTGDIPRKTKDNKDIYVRSSATVVKDEQGIITGYVGVSFDITEQKILQDKVDHLANIVEQSSDAIFSRSIDHRILSWNKGAEQMFGYTKEEAIGNTPIALGIVRLSLEELENITRSILEKGSWKFERDFYHKNGQALFGSLTANAVKNKYGEVNALVFIIKDITQQKKLEQQLKKYNQHLEEEVRARTSQMLKTEKRFKALTDNSNDVITLFDKSFNILYRSPSAFRITGWSNDEISFSGGMRNIHPDDISKVTKIWEDLLRLPGKPIPCLLRYLHKEGYYQWMEGIVVNLLHDEAVSAIVFNFRDVTERIEAEEKLKASENRFRALIENSNDIITLMDQSFQLIYRSPGATRVMGWTNEDMLGVEATRNIHPDDQAYAAEVVVEVKVNPGKIVHTRFRMRHKDGHYLWLEGTLTNLLQDADVNAIVFNFRNITERVEAEEKLQASEKQFRTTLDHMLEGIQIHDFNWRYIYANDAMVKYTHNGREAIMGKTLMEIYPGFEQSELFKAFDMCMRERVSKRMETEFVFPDGRRSIFQLSIQPHPDGLLILSEDITNIRNTENALQEERNKLDRIIATVPGLIHTFKITPEGKMSFPYASNSFEEILGYSPEIAANDAYQVINSLTEEHREKMEKSLNESALNMSKWQLQYSYLHPKKGLIWLEGSSIPVKGPDGSIMWHGILTDVTERKTTEDKINEQNLRLKTLSDNLPGMMLFQLTGDSFTNRKFTYVSNAVSELTGKTPDEVLADPGLLYGMIDKDSFPAMIEAELHSYKNKVPFKTEIRCIDHHGHPHWLNIFSSPRELNNGQMVWDGFHLDITESKKLNEQLIEREQQLGLLIQYSPVSIAMFDKEMRYIAASNRWASDYKLEGKELIGNIHYDIFPGLPESWKEIHQRCLQGAVEKRDEDFFTLSDGTALWVRWEVRPWYRASGEIGGIIIFAEDITDKKFAEQQKEFDSNNLKALINNTVDLIWSVDRNYNLITSNEAFDYTIKQLTGKIIEKGETVLNDTFSAFRLERHKSYYDRAFDGEMFTEVEHTGGVGDLWYEVSFYPIREGQTVIGTACYSRNITDKKHAEEEIRKSHERFELVVAATNDVIWDWDMATNTIWRNKNYYSHFGYDEKTTPSDTETWREVIHREDKERVLSGIITSIKTRQHFWTDEYRFLKADQSVAYVLDCGYILYAENGEPYRMVGAMLDITSRKTAEQQLKNSFAEKQAIAERLSSILNTLPATIALIDSSGCIIEVNDSWRQFANSNGYSGDDYWLGQNYLSFTENALGEEEFDGKTVAEGIRKVLQHQLPQFEYEYPCHSPEQQRWFRMIVTPLQKKEFAGAVVMHLDISEIKRLEQQRLKSKIEEQKKIAKAMLSGQEKERNHIGKELHDNINQILAGTKLYLDMAGNKNSEVKALVKYPMELIDTSIEEIRLLCHKIVTPIKDINLEELVRALMEDLEQHGMIKTTFQYEVAPGTLSDELKLNIYRIVQELTNNVLKYAKAKNVTASILTNDGKVNIIFTDDGQGFDPEKKRKGIGISNMLNRVNSFSGEIEIVSAEDKGCKTTVSIPI
jgi:PAS domain S-box-containing protein